MSRNKIVPVTVTRAVNTACDPACRFFPNFQGNSLTDASCDERGPGYYTSIPNADWSPDGLRVVVDESATSFLQNGAAWTLPFLEATTEDITLDFLFTVTDYVANPGSGVAVGAKVIHTGQSAGVTNYQFGVLVDPYVGGNQMDLRFSLSFVGFSSAVRANIGDKVHVRVQKPKVVSAGTPERYFINGVQVLSRSVKHIIGGIDTLLFGGYFGSAPSPGAMTIVYHEMRATSGLVGPTDGSSFTPPEYLPPPRYVTGLGDPAVSVGEAVSPDEADAEVYTPARASAWGWELIGSTLGPVAVETAGTASEDAPVYVPASVSWQVDFPPFPSEDPPELAITFDDTTWDLTGSAQTKYRNRALVAEGTWLPQVRYQDPSWDITPPTNGLKSLTAQAAPECTSVAGWLSATLASIGTFAAPPKDVCPVLPPLPPATSRFVVDAPVASLGKYPTGDFSVTEPIGRTSDEFTLTISSIGPLPMTISGVDWTGWFFNNTRRI